jgi:hypothetical protein
MTADEGSSICLIAHKEFDPDECSMLHIHDLGSGNGTTYFIGTKEELSFGLGTLSKEQLEDALGTDLFRELLRKIAPMS